MFDYTKNTALPSMYQVPEENFHIVIFTGGEYPAPEKTAAYWKSVKVPDFVIAADSGLDVCRIFSSFANIFYPCSTRRNERTFFSPNIILGDMDSISDRTLLDAYPDTIKKVFDIAKNHTDTELALTYAFRTAAERNREPLKRGLFKQSPFITLVGGDGGRIAHLFGIYNTFATPEHPSVWLCRYETLWYAPQKSRFILAGLTPMDKISILRVPDSYTGGSIKSHGLEWENPSFRQKGMPSISNRISDSYYAENKDVEIQIVRKNFILALPLGVCVRYLAR